MRKLVKTDIHTKTTIHFDFEFDEGVGRGCYKSVDVSEGDVVSIHFLDNKFGMKIESIIGKLSDIIYMPKRYNSTDISLRIDASADYNSNEYIVATKNILDIDLVDSNHDPKLPVESPITWNFDSVAVVQEGDEANPYWILRIPYERNMAGTICLSIKDKTTGKKLFLEKFVTETTNLNGSFTWSMRTFEHVSAELQKYSAKFLTDDEGFFIYQNGDNTKYATVANTDFNNDLIVPAGTVLDVTITHITNSGAQTTTITTSYTVTEDDVLKVTHT